MAESCGHFEYLSRSEVKNEVRLQTKWAVFGPL
jgi:hypothetical protein